MCTYSGWKPPELAYGSENCKHNKGKKDYYVSINRRWEWYL
jgi:hypothetical protein